MLPWLKRDGLEMSSSLLVDGRWLLMRGLHSHVNIGFLVPVVSVIDIGWARFRLWIPNYSEDVTVLEVLIADVANPQILHPITRSSWATPFQAFESVFGRSVFV